MKTKLNYAVWSGILALAATGALAGAAGPTDPQIAAIVVTANQVDIDAGKLAASKSHSKDVKDFAQLMITDHSGEQLCHRTRAKTACNAREQRYQPKPAKGW